jgi:hypothetical protein
MLNFILSYIRKKRQAREKKPQQGDQTSGRKEPNGEKRKSEGGAGTGRRWGRKSGDGSANLVKSEQ